MVLILKLSQIWPTGTPAGIVSFWHVSFGFGALPFWHRKMFQLILQYPYPSSGISHFCTKSWFLKLQHCVYKSGSGTRCVHCCRGVTSRPSQWNWLDYTCMYIHTLTHIYINMYFCIYLNMYKTMNSYQYFKFQSNVICLTLVFSLSIFKILFFDSEKPDSHYP